jgi:hypothetical protein
MRQGAGEVLPQVLLGFFRIPIRNRLHDQPVMLHDVLSLAWGRKVKAAEAVDMSAAAAHENPEFVHSGGFVEVLMEGLIGCGKCFEVFRFHEGLLLREKSLKPGDQPRVWSERQAPDDLELQGTP